MKISESAHIVLRWLYENMSKGTLSVSYTSTKISQGLNMEYDQITRCLFYLVDKGYLTGSISSQEASTQNYQFTVSLTARGVDVVEGII